MATYEGEPVTVTVLRLRIGELEQQLADAARLAEVARRELAAILAGCGSTEEQLRASVPVVALQRHLQACIERPTVDPVEQFAIASVEVVPAEELPANVHRLRPRTPAYEGSDFFSRVRDSQPKPPVRTSASDSDSKPQE